MILALAATQIEMRPFLQQWTGGGMPCLTLVTGVGPVETAMRLTRFLCTSAEKVGAVVLFGIGGAYLQENGWPQPALLDICLAGQEVFGDLGICLQDAVEYLDPQLTGDLAYPLDSALLALARDILAGMAVPCTVGNFITVNGATGTRQRGTMLHKRWQGLCENMEGAAVVRVCREFDLPCLELRAISNLVTDRDKQTWRVAEASARAALSAAMIIKGMSA